MKLQLWNRSFALTPRIFPTRCGCYPGCLLSSGFRGLLRRMWSFLVPWLPLSKSLAHQASVSALHTTFIGLKRREFYLSHLPAHFSDINKRVMLSSWVVCSDFLFNEADISRLLADTQASSSMRSQQALVDVTARSSGVRQRRFSPRRSPAHSSPSHRCRRGSGSPARPAKRVWFDSPAPSSAHKGSRSGFQK